MTKKSEQIVDQEPEEEKKDPPEPAALSISPEEAHRRHMLAHINAEAVMDLKKRKN